MKTISLRRFLLFLSFFTIISWTSVTSNEFDIILLTDATDSGVKSVAYLLIDGGYTHGLETGLTGEIYRTKKSRLTPQQKKDYKIADLTVEDASAYVSVCSITGVKKDEIAKGFKVNIDIPETTVDLEFEKAMEAFIHNDYMKAEHFFSLVVEQSPDDDNQFIEDQIKKCREKLIEERRAGMTRKEIRKEKAKITDYLLFSLHYMSRINYEAAEYYIEKILKVERQNPYAKKIKNIIEEKSEYLDAYLKREKTNQENKDKDTLPVEVFPEMIHEERPIYPLWAEQLGLQGRVYIRCLVDCEGEVIASEVEESSSFYMLDICALLCSYKNKFKPAIKNGRPIACWVTYRVEFILN